MKKTAITPLNATGLNLSKSTIERLKNKISDRKEDLLLDLLEQIEIHQREIKKLVKRVNEIDSQGYILEDENL